MSRSPQISIVMPSYQQAAFIEEAVRSVLSQREVAVELIVMDPGSTDGSRELLLKLQKEYAEQLQLHFEPDCGQADAIQRGMGLARGNVLAWLNSDDRLRPGALESAAAYLDSPEPRWLYGRCGIIDEEGRPISGGIVCYKNLRGRRFSIYKLLTEDFIPQMSTFWNRTMWDKVGGIDGGRHLDMDYDLFLKCALVTEPLVLPSYLADFRVHPEAKSSTMTFEAMNEAFLTARHYASKLGWRGKLAIMLHRVYAVRTKLIYRVIKP
jgi:glycosyltransferase involved in cell wall biosynthesis